MEYPKYLNDGKSFIKVLNPSQMIAVTIGNKMDDPDGTIVGVAVFTLDVPAPDDYYDTNDYNESTRQEFEKAFGEAMYQFAKTGATV